MIVDFHMHFLRWPSCLEGRCTRRQCEPWEAARAYSRENYIDEILRKFGQVTREALLFVMDRAGIDRAVVLSCPWLVPDEELADLCAGEPRLIPFMRFDPEWAGLDRGGSWTKGRRAGGTSGRLSRALGSKSAHLRKTLSLLVSAGFRGVKMYPTYDHYFPNDPRLFSVYGVLEQLGLPVLIHTGASTFSGAIMKYGEPLLLDEVASTFPGLTIVMAHSGRGLWHDQAFLLARLHRNVYMEISGLPPQKLLKLFPDIDDVADKVIFGSDWPASPAPGRMIEMIRQLPLSEGTKRKILGENASRALKAS